jgi:hypothetical protein
MSITPEEDGTTLLSGPVPDQSALFGLLHRVYDLGLPLVSVRLCNQQNLNVPRITRMNTNTT